MVDVVEACHNVMHNRRRVTPRPSGGDPSIAEMGNLIMGEQDLPRLLGQHSTPFLPDMAAVLEHGVGHLVPFAASGRGVGAAAPQPDLWVVG